MAGREDHLEAFPFAVESLHGIKPDGLLSKSNTSECHYRGISIVLAKEFPTEIRARQILTHLGRRIVLRMSGDVNSFRPHTELSIPIALHLRGDTHTRDTLEEWREYTTQHLIPAEGIIRDPSVDDVTWGPTSQELT